MELVYSGARCASAFGGGECFARIVCELFGLQYWEMW